MGNEIECEYTIHTKQNPLILDRTVLNGSDDFVIVDVTFDTEMTCEKHLRPISKVAA